MLEAYLHSSYTARKAGEGAASTGNAERGSYRAAPRVAASNLVLSPATGTLDELIARVGDGLYVENAAGLHSGVNVVSGEISVGVTGRLIENGALGRPVREVTIATDFLSLLGSVSRPGRRHSLDPALRQRVHAVGGGGADHGLGPLAGRRTRRKEGGWTSRRWARRF